MSVELRRSQERITQILRNWSAGSRTAADELFPLVYLELRRQARCRLRTERAGHTLQTTALIHEAYIKLTTAQKPVDWESRTHFFAIASNLMRQILVDYARTKHRVKRGGAADDLAIDEAHPVVAAQAQNLDLLALDEALNKLARLDEQQAKIVELRFFGGLSIAETATVLNLSETTVNRDWRAAKAWLRLELTRRKK